MGAACSTGTLFNIERRGHRVESYHREGRIYLKRSSNYNLFLYCNLCKNKKQKKTIQRQWPLQLEFGGCRRVFRPFKTHRTPFFRSLELIPGKPETIQPEADLRIVNASFGDLLKDPSGRTTVKFTYQVPAGILDDEDDEDDEVSQASKTTILCSLKPDTVRNQVHTSHFPRRSSGHI